VAEPENVSFSAELERALVAARGRWPDVPLLERAFFDHIEARLPEGEDRQAALRQLHTSDLYLACALERGDARALAYFEAELLVEVDLVLRRENKSEWAADLKQSLRERLFTGARPRIAEYGGRGPLKNWVRVLVARAVINFATRGPREQLADDQELAELALPSTHPEHEFLKNRYRGEFAVALKDAIAQLDVRPRNLLRLQLIDGLSRDEVGALYDVHGATAGRWLAEARRMLEANVRALLKQRLGIDSAELESIVKLIRSQLELDLGALE
jgi:RNA polymerase sigma-70 factor (ECF subfamily)